jgi:hypothetical protein
MIPSSETRQFNVRSATKTRNPPINIIEDSLLDGE